MRLESRILGECFPGHAPFARFGNTFFSFGLVLMPFQGFPAFCGVESS